MKVQLTIDSGGRTTDGKIAFHFIIGNKRILYFTLTPQQVGTMLLSGEDLAVDANLSDNNIKLIE